jgi:hypothetical protein
MNKKRTALGAVGILLVLLASAWGLGWFDGEDPVVAELIKLRDEGMKQPPPPAEAESRREEFRDRMEGLSEDQRRDFFEQSMPIMMKMFEKRMDEFFVLSPEEQQKKIDEQLDAFRDRQGADPQGGGPRGGPFGGGQAPNPEQFDQMRKRMLDVMSPSQRAKMGTYMKMFAQRAEERGLDPGPFGR